MNSSPLRLKKKMLIDISATNFGILLFLVFLGGFIDSIAGGGGIITLPAYLSMGIPAHFALGTNKFSGFFGTLFASIKYIRGNAVNLKIALIATIFSIVGAAAGSKIATIIDEDTIHIAILIITPLILVFFLIKDLLIKDIEKKNEITPIKTVLYSASIGFVVGIYDGLFGPGTGTFMTIGFNAFLGLNLIVASGNARLCNLGSNFGSLVVFLFEHKVLFPLAIFTAISGIAGNILGSNFALKKGERLIKPLITLVMVFIIIKIIRDRFLISP